MTNKDPLFVPPCHSVATNGGRGAQTTPEGSRNEKPVALEFRKGRRPKEWWAGAELNCRHRDFQSRALPTELPAHSRGESREPGAETQISHQPGELLRGFLCGEERGVRY